MITREQMQPNLNRLVHVVTDFGQEFEARFLLGPKNFEGWYIPSINKIMTQKQLRVKSFKNDRDNWTGYLPRKELDFIFSRRKTMDHADFLYEKNRYDMGLDYKELD